MASRFSRIFKGVVVSSVLAVFLMFGLYMGKESSLFADDGTEAKLLKKIEELENRIKSLEAKKSPKDTGPVVTKSDVEAIVDQKVALVKEEAGFKLPEVLKDITLSGFVDASYTYSFNHPDSGKTTGRVFDTEANSFNLQAAKIALEKLPAKTGGVGFRVDLLIGDDAKVIKPYGWNTDDVNLEQAYLDILMPVGKGLDVKAGKFVTLAGAEVIESKDNWNFSRSLLFGYAIPFTHTGLRASYPILDNLTAYFGVNNGWDDIKDNNKGKTIESALAWSPKDWLSFNLAGYYGPEESGNNHSNRALVDFIATYKPFEKLTFKINTDYAQEQDLVADGKAATWSGVAGYVRYDFNDKWSLSNRTEFFSDPNGVRLTSGTPADYWENTSTLELRPYKNLITRLEYRYDMSSQDIYTIGSKATDHQSTIGVEAIYAF
ncbi:MAG: porin [Candidatus Omnitrophica bacterium]|nr:porin [Candidatus Omnitrophota bacterium]